MVEPNYNQWNNPGTIPNPVSPFYPPDRIVNGIIYRWNPKTKSFDEVGRAFDPNTGRPTTPPSVPNIRPGQTQTLPPQQQDEQAFSNYILNGGTLDFEAWKNAGRPDTNAYDSYYQGTAPKGTPPPTNNAPTVDGTAGGGVNTQGTALIDDILYGFYISSGGRKNKTDWIAAGKPVTDAPTVGEGGRTGGKDSTKAAPFPTEKPQPGYYWKYDPTMGEWYQEKDPYTGRQPYSPYGKNPYDDPNTPEEEGQFNTNTGEWEPPIGYETPAEKADREWRAGQLLQQQTQQQYQAQQDALTRQFQQEQFNWEKQQADARLVAEKEALLAQKRANPASWLEYAQLAGQTPVVQPWMKPLGQAGQNLQIGQPIPGYSPTGSSMNLPGLTTPSAQYMNRIAPSSRQQYMGYEQARTGAGPEDTQWMLWNNAPPAGYNPELTYRK